MRWYCILTLLVLAFTAFDASADFVSTMNARAHSLETLF